MTKAIILAGGSKSKSREDFKSEFDNNKAFVKLKGYPMITYIIDVLLKVNEVDDIYVVGPEENLNEVLDKYKVKILPEKGTVLDNILTATEVIEVEKGENVLLVTSDIPLITPEAIKDFLSKCKGNYDLFYPVIEKKENDKKFPNLNRTFVRFKEGYFTGGNVFFINPRKVSQCYNVLQKIIFLRKKPFKLAMLLGLTFVLRIITGQLNLSQVENKVSSLLNIRGKAIITSYPELGTDVDKKEDLLWLEKNFFKEKMI